MSDFGVSPNYFNFFEVGFVKDVDMNNATCTILRAEGGEIKHVPVLNTLGSGGQSTGVVSLGNLRKRMVLLVNVQGVLCVLATIPDGSVLSKRVI